MKNFLILAMLGIATASMAQPGDPNCGAQPGCSYKYWNLTGTDGDTWDEGSTHVYYATASSTSSCGTGNNVKANTATFSIRNKSNYSIQIQVNGGSTVTITTNSTVTFTNSSSDCASAGVSIPFSVLIISVPPGTPQSGRWMLLDLTGVTAYHLLGSSTHLNAYATAF